MRPYNIATRPGQGPDIFNLPYPSHYFNMEEILEEPESDLIIPVSVSVSDSSVSEGSLIYIIFSSSYSSPSSSIKG